MRDVKRIGVLGGMAPQAAIVLQQRLVTNITADDDASHVPLLIDLNPPNFIAIRLGTETGMFRP